MRPAGDLISPHVAHGAIWVWDTWTRLSSESFEPLVGFLAYLEPKLCHKKQTLVKISTPTKGNLGWITPSLCMAITRSQNRLESCSSPVKTCSLACKKIFKLNISGFCWCLHNERMFVYICLHLSDLIISWESNNRADFVAQSFIWFWATIRIFRGFDGLSSISGSKVKAK